MEVPRFEDIQTEFTHRVIRAVYCSVATIDQKNRPRSRIMHPIWDGPIGWAISWPQSHKAKYLQRNPHVSMAYIQDKDKPVYVDCRAEWIDEAQEKERIWRLYRTTPPPLGFDPAPFYQTIHDPYFGLLRFTPWRIELGNLQGEPII